MMPETLTLFWTGIDLLSAWFLTYLIHSTLLIATAALTARWVANELALQDAIWKIALFGGLLTATVQVGLGIDPLAGSWAVGSPASYSVVESTAPLETEAVHANDPLAAVTTIEQSALFLAADRSSETASQPTSSLRAPEQAVIASSGRNAAGRRAFTLAWLVIGVGLIGALALSYGRLRSRLVGERRRVDGSEQTALARLIAKSRTQKPVDLYAHSKISVPLARGLNSREIYLPERSLNEMTPELGETVIAHELAHLERRDPSWLLAARALEAGLCAQPLNRYARRQIQEIAEYRADDWAVRHTGRPISLAKCLAEVAEWTLDSNAWNTVPALAVDDTRLGRRVQRLLARDYPRPETPRPRWVLPAALSLLGTLALLAPGVRPADAGVSAEDPVATEERVEQPEASHPPVAPSPIEESLAIAPTLPREPHPTVEKPAVPNPIAAPQARPQAVPQPVPHAAPAPAPVAEPTAAPRAAPAPLAHPSPPRAPRAERIERLRQVRLSAEEEARLAAIAAELAAEALQFEAFQSEDFARLAAELEQIAIPDPETLAEINEIASAVAARTLSENSEEIARLQSLALEIATQQGLAQEELEQIQTEMQDLAKSLRPSEEERERLQEELRSLVERARPSDEELRQIETEIEREMEQMRREMFQERKEQIEERREVLEQKIEKDRERMRRDADEARQKIERKMQEEREIVQRELRVHERATAERLREAERRMAESKIRREARHTAKLRSRSQLQSDRSAPLADEASPEESAPER